MDDKWVDLILIVAAGFGGLIVLWYLGWAVAGYFMRRPR